MTTLDRNALACNVVGKPTVELFYEDQSPRMRRLCESHERLRMEVEGFEAMRDGVEIRIADLEAENAKLKAALLGGCPHCGPHCDLKESP